MSPIIKVLGPPGTGKTTHLMHEMEQQLAQGIRPIEIGFITFTKKASVEAVERACQKFGYTPKDLPYFRTIHSLAYAMLGVRHGELIQWSHLKELGKRTGIKMTGRVSMDEDEPVGMMGDRMLFLENLARIRKVSYRQVWEEQNDQELQWSMFKRVCDEYTSFKAQRGLIDFTDLLAKYVNHPLKPKFKVLFIDEAQDLSALQWDLVEQLIANTSVGTLIAGDDDQAIFQWAGADVGHFIALPATQTRVLDQSYRIPSAVHPLALAVSQRIKARLAKEFKPRLERGSLSYHNELSQVDLSQGEWLLLCRNKHQVAMLAEHCRQQYVPYEAPGPTPLKHEQLRAIGLWEKRRNGEGIGEEDLELLGKYAHPKAAAELPWFQALTKISFQDVAYYRGLRSRNESLFQRPRVRISTIHGAKGGEAENVLLLTDIASRNEDNMRKAADEEHRVFYVGVTRAKKHLHVIRPMTNVGYRL